MGRSVRVALLFLVAVACSKSARDKPGDCLQLPGAQRSDLAVSPDEDALYWLETVQQKDYQGEAVRYRNLVRFDLETRRAEIVVDHVSNPLLFMRDQIVVLRPDDGWRAALVDRVGHVQELTPAELDVIDMEQVDDHMLILLAEYQGIRALYTLDLDHPRPEYLADADVLLTTAAGHVFGRRDDQGIAIDLTTRRTRTFKVAKKGAPNRDGFVYRTAKAEIAVQNMFSGISTTLVETPRNWKINYQQDSVLVRSPVKEHASFAWLIASGITTELPTVLDDTTILATAQQREQTWALIGHNTANYVGDLASTDAETSVCLLPRTGRVSFPTRNVPERYQLLAPLLFAAQRQLVPETTLQIFEAGSDPVAVSMRLPNTSGALDIPLMRRWVRQVHQRVTSILGDPEVKTEVHFADRQVASYRWRRERLRWRTAVGMGDALLLDPSEFDVAIDDDTTAKADGKLTCAGTITNLATRKLVDIELRCSTDRAHTIRIPELPPGVARPFSQVFDNPDDARIFHQVRAHGELLETLDRRLEERDRKVLDIAVATYEATRLALEDRNVTKDEITVTMVADPEFDSRTEDDKRAAVAEAYRRYGALRELHKKPADIPMTMNINIETTDISYDFDGTTLTRSE